MPFSFRSALQIRRLSHSIRERGVIPDASPTYRVYKLAA